MEIGNLISGNSRGNYEVPRELVESKIWTDLLYLLHMDTYGIMLENEDLIPNQFGGYTYTDENGKVLFEIFPYWWNGCTCGAEDENVEIYRRIKYKYISDVEMNDYYWLMTKEDELTEAQKTELKRLKHIFDEIEMEYRERMVSHKDDCLEVKHNFIYMPGTKDEFWIDWYKYPFRDSYMSKDFNIKEIEDIFNKCIDIIENQIKERN